MADDADFFLAGRSPWPMRAVRHPGCAIGGDHSHFSVVQAIAGRPVRRRSYILPFRRPPDLYDSFARPPADRNSPPRVRAVMEGGSLAKVLVHGRRCGRIDGALPSHGRARFGAVIEGPFPPGAYVAAIRTAPLRTSASTWAASTSPCAPESLTSRPVADLTRARPDRRPVPMRLRCPGRRRRLVRARPGPRRPTACMAGCWVRSNRNGEPEAFCASAASFIPAGIGRAVSRRPEPK